MTPRARYAIAVGAFGAWLACVMVACWLAAHGHKPEGRVFGLVSLPWLVIALWADRRQGR